MDYIKIRFGNDFGTSDSRFDKTIEDMFRSMSPMFSLSERAWKPQMDIYETPQEITILAEVAGVDKDNLEVEISSRAIRIRGNREEMARDKNTTYRLAEIQYGTFERILYLPAMIDTDKVSASYLNGFLQIRLAKMLQNQTHKITISER